MTARVKISGWEHWPPVQGQCAYGRSGWPGSSCNGPMPCEIHPGSRAHEFRRKYSKPAVRRSGSTAFLPWLPGKAVAP